MFILRVETVKYTRFSYINAFVMIIKTSKGFFRNIAVKRLFEYLGTKGFFRNNHVKRLFTNVICNMLIRIIGYKVHEKCAVGTQTVQKITA